MHGDTGILPPRYLEPKRIAGGMADVYLATDELLGRHVAVKVLADRYAWDEEIRKRFTREALAAARLSGEPGVLTIFDVGEWSARPYIVMEHLSGGSLEDRLRRSRPHRDRSQVLRWLEEAAAAIDAAHRKGIVHRDIKPANLLLDGEGGVHVADFGIASAAGLDSLTLTGTVLGTAGYLSPEQARGERAGPASDRYALAVVAYELLSGARPFADASPTAEAIGHANAPVPPIPRLPPNVNAVFQRALAKEPAARYPNAAEFVAALRRAVATAPPMARPVSFDPRRLALVAAFLLVAAGAGAVVAALVTGGNHTASRFVTRNVTHEQTVTAPAPPPPPPPRPPPPPPPPRAQSSLGAHELNDRGYSLVQQNNWTAAIPLLLRAVQKLAGTGPSDPYEAYANYNLGYALYRSGRCTAAAPYFLRADRLEPDRSEPGAYLRLARRCS